MVGQACSMYGGQMDQGLIRRAREILAAQQRARETPQELISRAMRELARRQHATEDLARRREIMAVAGRVSWMKLTPEGRAARIARMVAGRRRQREVRRNAT